MFKGTLEHVGQKNRTIRYPVEPAPLPADLYIYGHPPDYPYRGATAVGKEINR